MVDENVKSATGDREFDDETCRRYLLGELSEAKREQFEEAYFTDDALFERFLAVKDELLDAYARGELAEETHSRFAAHFQATPPRRRQLSETKDFIKTITQVSAKAAPANGAVLSPTDSAAIASPQSSRQSLADFFRLRPLAWQAGLAALLLAAAAGAWLFVRNPPPPSAGSEQAVLQENRNEQVIQRPTPSPTDAPLPPATTDDVVVATSPTPTPANVNQTPANARPTPANVNQSPANAGETPQTTPTPTAKPVEQQQPTPPPTPPAQIWSAQIASVILSPVASRGAGGANTLRLGPETRAARVSLVFRSDDYRSYSAAVTAVSGGGVWQQKNLKANGSGTRKSVTLQLAPALLRGQDYIVTLRGQTAAGQTETIGEYYFRVEHSPSQSTQKPTRQP